MSTKPLRFRLMPIGRATSFQDTLLEDDGRTLGELLKRAPAVSVGTPFDERALRQPVNRLRIEILEGYQPDPATPLYLPPEFSFFGNAGDIVAQDHQVTPNSHESVQAGRRVAGDSDEEEAAPRACGHPGQLHQRDAICLAYQHEIDKIVTFLRSRLSVLVVCEKLVAPFLQQEILRRSYIPNAPGISTAERKLQPVYLDVPLSGEDSQGDSNGLSGSGGPMERMRQIIQDLKDDQVLVATHLDLLGGDGGKTLGRDSRTLTELIYNAADRLLLAFADPSLPLPEVILARFAVRLEVQGMPREVSKDGHRVATCTALVTAEEASHFSPFNPEELYKIISGLNPLRLRQALAYAVQEARDRGFTADNPATFSFLQQNVQAFKVQNSEQFAIPDVKFDDIGGYGEVKRILLRSLSLMSGMQSVPDEKLRRELIPRGYLFHGPPGTGKTLFAKAIANSLNATIRVVSGPEVTDMYVGESERKIRALFADARRNAPSVIVFDEFDSIAAERTGRDDGGSRAGNALVAQILTEMDGFRADVPMLVVGTTNRLELVDRALLRPSRFQPISIGLPDWQARWYIARIHANHFHLPVSDTLLDEIARATETFNGDEIRSLFRDAYVGLHCEDPPRLADPHNLGILVGRIRSRKDEERIQKREYRPHRQEDGIRRPQSAMVSLTPNIDSPHRLEEGTRLPQGTMFSLTPNIDSSSHT